MKVYTVIPISRGISKNLLSYFGPDSMPLGSLVSVPIRGKSTPAIVVKKQEVASIKSELRSAKFELKKIISVKEKNFLPEKFLESALETADFFASPIGSFLGAVIPKHLLESTVKVRLKSGGSIHGTGEKFVIQADDEERIINYKSFIREEFARKNSVFFCLPTIEDIQRVEKSLDRGIEQFTVSFHSGLSKKEFLKRYEVVKDGSHPVLIIGTVPFLSVFRQDIGSIILDRENSRGYRTLSRPYIDLKKFAEVFAKNRKARFILGDSFLSIETLWRQKNDELLEFSPVKFRNLSSAECVLIDMKQKRDSDEKEFRVLSPELEELIEFNKKKNQNLFIFNSRKGLSPVTACGDCGKVVVCKSCGAVLVLHTGTGDKENFFLCHKCGEKRSSTEKCENCRSWKLNPLGIGIEKLEFEIKKRFPELKTFRVDKESVKTQKKAREIVLKFLSTPGSVLLGTEMALLSLSEPVENTAVSSLDSMFSIPDFRINERIFYILQKIRSLAKNIFLIQTRNSSNHLFEKALSGSVTEFFRQEIEERERFNYPPFKVFVKISLQGKKANVLKEMEAVEKMFEEEDLSIFTGSLSGTGEKIFSVNALMRFSPKDWPKKSVVEKILLLPPQFKVQVDPESLL